MLFETNKDKGRVGMALGIAYFGCNGYTVNIPLNDIQWYDFVIEKCGLFYTVQCKSTGSNKNEIELKSKGGTNGKAYDSILDHPLDLLFCIDKDMKMFVIPVDDIRKSGNKKSISLRTKISNYANIHTFDTTKYIVTI